MRVAQQLSHKKHVEFTLEMQIFPMKYLVLVFLLSLLPLSAWTQSKLYVLTRFCSIGFEYAPVGEMLLQKEGKRFPSHNDYYGIGILFDSLQVGRYELITHTMCGIEQIQSIEVNSPITRVTVCLEDEFHHSKGSLIDSLISGDTLVLDVIASGCFIEHKGRLQIVKTDSSYQGLVTIEQWREDLLSSPNIIQTSELKPNQIEALSLLCEALAKHQEMESLDANYFDCQLFMNRRLVSQTGCTWDFTLFYILILEDIFPGLTEAKR